MVRTKLIAVLVTLLAVVCLVIGVLSEFALSAFLTRQVDGQLHDTVARSRVTGAALQTAGTTLGTVHAWAGGTSGEILATAPGAQVPVPQPLGAADLAVLREIAPDAPAQTVSLSVGRYRVLAAGAEVFGLPLAQADATVVTAGFVLAGVAAVGVLGAGVAGALLVRRTLRPLDEVAAAAAKVTGLPLDRGEVALSVRVPVTGTATEVAQVGEALNRVLGHISHALEARQSSETRTRRFVADASHELRTPLAAIRGYAELTRLSGDRVPPDIGYAMKQVEAEAARMGTLVDELLLRARTGFPQDRHNNGQGRAEKVSS
ncbi:HAMP domain-containing sensor histidine kinase [Amycolatopsis pithecellobii]|uniref:histidine kinase n=1 Tax=Amycolatopsis pithecellobii TaxID=664692 RepID=A0A6N7YUZ2_9PSEU|nr:HAMP domain-containing sensor histidine kinase [Amycolatopsis pithecellobii]MTD56897.1 HAMP domain-containing protein [Amycolatopsis pithecellobii]